jgi:hypothetical protein
MSQPKTKKMGKLQQYSLFYSVLIAAVLLAAAVFFFLNYKPVKFIGFTDSATGVSINYPADWTKAENVAPGAIVAFMAPKEDELAVFNPNVNVTFVDLKNKKYSNAEITQMTLLQVSALMEGYVEMVESGPFYLAGRPGYKIIFKGKNVATPLQYLNAWVFVGERVYVVTYASTALEFKRHLPLVKKMLASFKVP